MTAMPLPLEMRAEAAAEDARDGHDMPDEVAEWGAELYEDDWYRMGER